MAKASERIVELMEKLHISQIEIVNKTGISKSNISLYVSGKREPKHDKIYMIAIAFNVDPVWLMGFDVPMRPEKKSASERASDDTNVLKKLNSLKPEYRKMIEHQIDLFLELQNKE